MFLIAHTNTRTYYIIKSLKARFFFSFIVNVKNSQLKEKKSYFGICAT